MTTKKDTKKTEGLENETQNSEHIHDSHGFTFTDKKGFGESIGATISLDTMEAIEKAMHDFLHGEGEDISKKSVKLYKFLESKAWKALGITLKNNADYFFLGYVWKAMNDHDSIEMEIGGGKDIMKLLLLKSLLS